MKHPPEQEAQLRAAEAKLAHARTAIVIDHPFFASILLKRETALTFDVPTACVNAHGHIKVSPAFIADLTVPHVVYLLCHEIGHVIMDHLCRRGVRDAKLWNIAGDAVINDVLAASKVGEPIPGGVDMPGSRHKLTDTVYNELLQNPPPPNTGQGGIGDDLDESGVTQEQAEALAAEMRVEIAQAAQAAKMRGKLPAALAEFVESMIASRTPWFDILERHMIALVRGEYTWARPNRRFIQSGHYLPSTGKTPQLGTIAIQVDVSGSISPVELQHYDGHLRRIVEMCDPETVHVLYTDTRVVKHETFARGEEFGLNYMSGGGTDMPAGFDFLAEQGIEPDVMVILTDGYTPWGDEPGYPVVWCVSSDAVPSHGELVKFSLEE